MTLRNKLFRKFVRCKNSIRKEQFYEEYKEMRTQVKNQIDNSKKIFYNSYFDNFKKDTSKIWQGIKSIIKLKNKSISSPSCIKIDKNKITDFQNITDIFNDYFTNIGPSIASKIPKTSKKVSDFLKNRATNSVFFNPTTKNEIIKVISNLNKGKALGPNSIPVDILKYNAEIISLPLSRIINASFHQGIFPDLCKLARVIPVYKKGDSFTVENYRPISLLSVFSKIFEKCAYVRAYSFLEKHKLLYTRQFGFRSNYSTSDALVSIIEIIKTQIDSGKFVTGIFIDLEKAFDTVDHNILINKLEHYGFRGNIKDWFKSFLSNREQFVSAHNCKSNIKKIVCGVPQGSTLGPLLFLIYLNDLQNAFDKSIVHNFADDTNILFSSKKLETIKNVLNYELKNLVIWLRCNKLSLNEDKTKLVVFRPYNKKLPANFYIKINKYKIKPCPYVKYLGVLIDEHLSWNTHINSLCQQLSQSIGIISKIRHYVPLKSCISVYYAIFYSYLRYGCLTWQFAAKQLIQKIEIIHKKCIRVLNFSHPQDHTLPLFKRFELLKLKDIFQMNIIIFFYKYSKKQLPVSLLEMFSLFNFTHQHETRSRNLFRLPLTKTTRFGSNSLRNFDAKVWNEFSKNISDENFSFNKIKSTYRKKCLDKYD